MSAITVGARGDASEQRIVIIGAGPCGLGCARELTRLGHRNWLLLEAAAGPGGLASSVVDDVGFTWDLGGHVVFSHYGEFDALLHEAMGEEIWSHERSSYVRFGDRWIPYPFQNNLRHLPDDVVAECLEGLRRAPGSGNGAAADFATWMRAVFGDGITRHFMAPYNFKVWATRGEHMSAGWIAERVAVIDYERVAENVREGRDDLAWGPNNKFVFPAVGGTGEIYRRIAARLAERIRYESPVAAVDAGRRILTTAGGERIAYDALVSTMPLDKLVQTIQDSPQALRDAAGALRHNGVYMVGVGYETPLADDKSWMYFPDPEVPFYRATNFAKYSPANVPESDTGRFCAYMTETAYSDQLPVPRDGLELRVEAGLRRSGVIGDCSPVASIHVEDIPYAYPVPTVGRDAALNTIQPWLMERGILSRGRFGAWRYEAGNMDHSVKMGIDAARRLLSGAAEELWTL